MQVQSRLVETLDERSICERVIPLSKDAKIDLLVSAVLAPILTWPAYEDILTNEQRARIKIERLKAVKTGSYDTATDYEAMVYLSTASLANPLDDQWFHIYAMLFKRFYPDKADFLSEYDTRIDKLCDEPALKDLKDWIFKKQKQALKRSNQVVRSNETSLPRKEIFKVNQRQLILLECLK